MSVFPMPTVRIVGIFGLFHLRYAANNLCHYGFAFREAVKKCQMDFLSAIW
jgi:uncharacterized protein (DUF488 family)